MSANSLLSAPDPSPPSPVAGAAGRCVRLFIRDDDVGELTAALRFFVEIFISRRLPVSYQIIPARLTGECARFLRDTSRDHPDLVELGQHGLNHQMILRGRTLKREFGPERSLRQQSEDIETGMAILRDHFAPDLAIAVFTPPQHKFDRNTLIAARAAGHQVFSAASYPTPHHRLAYAIGRRLRLSSFRHHGISHHGARRPETELDEVSISIAVDNGRTPSLAAHQIGEALATASATTNLVGLMFHHALYDDSARSRRLEAIADVLAGYGAENFHRLATLAGRDGLVTRPTDRPAPHSDSRVPR